MLKNKLDLPSVTASVNYLDDPCNSDPSRGLEFHPSHEHRTNMRLKAHDVVIRDGRSLVSAFSIDREGFCLVEQRTSVKDFHNTEEVARYQPRELEEAVKAVTGASRAFGVGPQFRFSETSKYVSTSFHGLPARFVHGDFYGDSGQAIFQAWHDINIRDYPRIAVFNAWRVITPPPQDIPLAICDMRSVALAESVPLTAMLEEAGAPVQFGMAAYKGSPNHEWFYFSDMNVDELLIFKTYESDPARPYASPHTAFNDPTCPSTAVPRGSAEARILAVFD